MPYRKNIESIVQHGRRRNFIHLNPTKSKKKKSCYSIQAKIKANIQLMYNINQHHIKQIDLIHNNNDNEDDDDQDDFVDLTHVNCSKCGQGEVNDDSNDILICDGKECYRAYHVKCLEPPVDMNDISNDPDDDWVCHECFAIGRVFSLLNTAYHMNCSNMTELFPYIPEEKYQNVYKKLYKYDQMKKGGSIDKKNNQQDQHVFDDDVDDEYVDYSSDNADDFDDEDGYDSDFISVGKYKPKIKTDKTAQDSSSNDITNLEKVANCSGCHCVGLYSKIAVPHKIYNSKSGKIEVCGRYIVNPRDVDITEGVDLNDDAWNDKNINHSNMNSCSVYEVDDNMKKPVNSESSGYIKTTDVCSTWVADFSEMKYTETTTGGSCLVNDDYDDYDSDNAIENNNKETDKTIGGSGGPLIIENANVRGKVDAGDKQEGCKTKEGITGGDNAVRNQDNGNDQTLDVHDEIVSSTRLIANCTGCNRVGTYGQSYCHKVKDPQTSQIKICGTYTLHQRLESPETNDQEPEIRNSKLIADCSGCGQVGEYKHEENSEYFFKPHYVIKKVFCGQYNVNPRREQVAQDDADVGEVDTSTTSLGDINTVVHDGINTSSFQNSAHHVKETVVSSSQKSNSTKKDHLNAGDLLNLLAEIKQPNTPSQLAHEICADHSSTDLNSTTNCDGQDDFSFSSSGVPSDTEESEDTESTSAIALRTRGNDAPSGVMAHIWTQYKQFCQEEELDPKTINSTESADRFLKFCRYLMTGDENPRSLSTAACCTLNIVRSLKTAKVS